VQGGTFLNDAVLRSFELELGTQVVRPTIAGIMGAYGAALHAHDLAKKTKAEKSTVLDEAALADFSYTVQSTRCGLCGNNCRLTVNRFGKDRRFIAGNRCERPLGKKKKEDIDNLYTWKYRYLRSLHGGENRRGTVGIPMVLNMYETLPFWYTFFTSLGYEVMLSPESSRELYADGQHTIPSDTVCYPAKLAHGHIEKLIDMGVDVIFYPCMPYNFNEHKGDNHYNCPVVAYYPELLAANVGRLQTVAYWTPYCGIHRRKDFAKHMGAFLKEKAGIDPKEVKAASKAAYEAYDNYMASVRQTGAQMIERARKDKRRIIVLSGRPYHIDPEINHGIHEMLSSFGLTVVTEDAVSDLAERPQVKVLNQWMYHSRLYSAAAYVTTQPDMQLIQLVSFGCGIDAITTDEVRRILEEGNKLYTQLKIDEINNLGAVRIRIRSLLAAMDARETNEKEGKSDGGVSI
ncbi:MAG: acyl-CoA dehydratase activase-related protein, partial [Acutalibacteraceae bacterium]